MADLKQKKVNAKYELLINGFFTSKMEDTVNKSVEVEQDKKKMKRISFITVDIVQIIQSYFGHLGFSINKLEEKNKKKKKRKRGHTHIVAQYAAFDMFGDSYGPNIKTTFKKQQDSEDGMYEWKTLIGQLEFFKREEWEEDTEAGPEVWCRVTRKGVKVKKPWNDSKDARIWQECADNYGVSREDFKREVAKKGIKLYGLHPNDYEC